MTQKRILLAALNWGLGHATRCIPIIDALLDKGVEVILASDGDALALWQRQYPHLKSIELPSYQVHYKYQNMFVNMGLQLPKFLKVIRKERKFIASIISTYKIDALISDNRYGVHHPSCPSIFMSHQLKVKIPNLLISKAVELLSHQIFQNFDQIWVPDYANIEESLSGELSHKIKLKRPIRYLGPLSRLRHNPIAKAKYPEYEIVALLSGPEPQRTYFEEKLLQQLTQVPLKSLIIQGKPQEKSILKKQLSVDLLPFMNGDALQAQLQHAGLVISRSGYSSIMDFAVLGLKQLLFIPTPGQTEQLYLAQNAFKNKFANYQEQDLLALKTAWEERQKYKGYPPILKNNPLNSVIEEFLRLKK